MNVKSTIQWTVIGLLVVALVSQVVLIAVVRPQSGPRPGLLPGDTIPRDLPVLVLRDPPTVQSLGHLLVRGECRLLIFFESSCPACELIAPDWEEQELLHIGEAGRAQVTWITVSPEDTGARRFLDVHGLARPGLSLTSSSAWEALGITHWPMMYLVDGQGTVLASPQGRPTEIVGSLPSCTSGTASPSRTRSLEARGRWGGYAKLH